MLDFLTKGGRCHFPQHIFSVILSVEILYIARLFCPCIGLDIPMHQNAGKTLAQCLSDRTDYAKNPEKTDDGRLVSSYECDAKTADAEFLFSKRQYRQLTGRVQESDVIAYQIRQSFKPGEVTPEEANQLGYEFAKRFTKGNHAFIVCTHTDKQHDEGTDGKNKG